MKSEPSNLASDFLASTRRYLDLPDEPLERHRAFLELKEEWKEFFKILLHNSVDDSSDTWYALGHAYSNG